MENKNICLQLNSKELLNKTFKSASPGYNALDVDEFLDKIILDYKAVESNFLSDKNYIISLKNEVSKLRKNVETLEIENKSLKAKIGGISDISKANSSNIEIIKRVSALEKALWKLGVNPTNIK